MDNIPNEGSPAAFITGDYVICRSGGVWKILGIEDESVRISLHEGPAEKTVPFDEDEIIRRISSEGIIMEAVERIPFIRTIQAPNDRMRRELYAEAMAKYDEIEWIRVIKTAYLRQRERRFMPYEASFSEEAKKYLHGEISVLLKIPMDGMEDYIASAVSKDSL
jgi:CarD family transcriptional regulator